MNKKGKFYSNNKTVAVNKTKDIQQKSNQKQMLSRPMERRKKANQISEETSEKYPKVKTVQNKSKKIKVENNEKINSRNEKPPKRKEYANTISVNVKMEENTHPQEKEKNYNYNQYDNKEEKDDEDNFKPIIIKFNDIEKKSVSKKQTLKKYQIKNKNEEEGDSSDEEKEGKDDDLLYRTLYRSSKKNVDNLKEKEEKIRNKEKELKNKTVNNERNINNNFDIEMEQTDNLYYNNEDKKIQINAYNYKTKPHKKSLKKPINKPKENKMDLNSFNENKIHDSPKSYEKRKIISSDNYNPERTIDLYVIDDDYDKKSLTKTKQKINRKNNKFREILIEKFATNMPMKDEKFTGFIFIRKSKGKKMYTLELPDNIDQINEIFKNESIMIKNQIIQIIPLNKIQSLNIQNQNEIKRAQNEKNLEKELEKEKELVKDKERQITLLKNKNEDLNNTIKKQTKQIAQNEKEMKVIKFNHEQLKDSFQALDKENKSLKSQIQAQKIRRKSIQMQIEEESNPSLQEMKDRIQKYKNDLRKSVVLEDREKNQHRKSSMDAPFNNVLQEKEKYKSEDEKDKKIEEEENYVDDYNYDIYDEKDPRAKKMKKAMARFRNKYKDIIIENKKNEKEKEEKEKEQVEKKLILDSEKDEEENSFIKEIEEREKKEKEEKERKQKEEQERKERERKLKEEQERKERERKEKEEKDKKEKEKKERERKEKEEKDKKEKEKKEREKKEKEEKENNKFGPFGGGGQSKMVNNFAKMLGDKMKFGPMPGAMRKTVGNIDYNPKPQIIIEKKVDVVNLIQGQQFKRTNKKKPTRKMFTE